MTTRTIQLHKSDTAVYGDIMHTAKANRYDPVPPLIRRLLAERLIEPGDVVEIGRGEALCFKPCRAIHWAAFDTVDDPRDGLVRRPAFVGPHVHVVTGSGARQQRGRLRHERRANEADTGSPG